jgi:ribulose-5-phosphate 4-epimerase/fuculose-1-phosphate aldolase
MSNANADSLVASHGPNHPANLICELCKLFYNNGWVTGTGGGISIRKGYVILKCFWKRLRGKVVANLAS